jgi:DNA-binding transcriptional ArsR family regulator
VDRHGRVTSTLLARALDLPVRTVRYHLEVLTRHGLLAPEGEKRGRTYRRATGEGAIVSGEETRSAAILGAIFERGGRIGAEALRRLVRQHGYDPRVVGTLHGRRLAHLRRDRRTGESVLTTRGRELAEQHLFAKQLTREPPRVPA